jgi:hypothetical protein
MGPTEAEASSGLGTKPNTATRAGAPQGEREAGVDPPRKGMSDFRKALMLTSIPIVATSVISLLVQIAKPGATPEYYTGFFLALIPDFLILVSIVAAIVLAIRGKRQLAAGMWAGVGIGVVSLGVSCFAMGQV